VDNITSCESAEEDLVTVVVVGGPLAVTAEATDPLICDGGSTQLHALASGGNEYYEYTWYASTGPLPDPPNSPEPFVNPTTTTTYTVVVTDLFNVIEANVEVVVSSLPAVDLGPDRYECPYDTITLSANIPDMNYYWSNGSTGESIKIGTTGIGFDIKEVWLEMENEHGCKNVDTIVVYFDFANCFGVGESLSGAKAAVYPNPTSGSFTLSLEGFKGGVEMAVSSLDGRKILSQKVDTEGDGTLQEHFDLAGQPKGVYLLKVTGLKEVLVCKIILE
jgi:hypothetical protein